MLSPEVPLFDFDPLMGFVFVALSFIAVFADLLVWGLLKTPVTLDDGVGEPVGFTSAGDSTLVVVFVFVVAVWAWEWSWILGLTCTSQGGGALLYDGTILNVTEPRASR